MNDLASNNDIQRSANRAILKSAVCHAIFNEDGSIADVRRSVLVEVLIPAVNTASGAHMPETHAMCLYSGPVFDSMPDLRATVANLPAGSVLEVWDGRYLFGHAVSATGYLKLANIGGTLTETDTF